MALRIFGKLLCTAPCLQRDAGIMLERVELSFGVQLSELLCGLLHQLPEGKHGEPNGQDARFSNSALSAVCQACCAGCEPVEQQMVSTNNCWALGRSQHDRRACRPCLHKLAMSDKTPQGGSGVQLHSGGHSAGKFAGLLVGPGVQQIVRLLQVALRQADFFRGSRLSRHPGRLRLSCMQAAV